MLSVNEVTLMGHVGGDPTIRRMQNGEEVANISLATSTQFKDSGGVVQKHTEWHRIAVFGRQVPVVKDYVRKGHKLMLRGTLRTRGWEDNDGVKRSTTEIRVSDGRGMVNLLEPRPDSDEDGGGGERTHDDAPTEEEEIPY